MWGDLVETTPSLAQSRTRRGEPLEPGTTQRPRTVASADTFQKEAENGSRRDPGHDREVS